LFAAAYMKIVVFFLHFLWNVHIKRNKYSVLEEVASLNHGDI